MRGGEGKLLEGLIRSAEILFRMLLFIDIGAGSNPLDETAILVR